MKSCIHQEQNQTGMAAKEETPGYETCEKREARMSGFGFASDSMQSGIPHHVHREGGWHPCSAKSALSFQLSVTL